MAIGDAFFYLAIANLGVTGESLQIYMWIQSIAASEFASNTANSPFHSISSKLFSLIAFNYSNRSPNVHYLQHCVKWPRKCHNYLPATAVCEGWCREEYSSYYTCIHRRKLHDTHRDLVATHWTEAVSGGHALNWGSFPHTELRQFLVATHWTEAVSGGHALNWGSFWWPCTELRQFFIVMTDWLVHFSSWLHVIMLWCHVTFMTMQEVWLRCLYAKWCMTVHSVAWQQRLN